MKRNKLRVGGQILYIPVELLSSDPIRPRIYFNNEDLTDLCSSISELGVLKPLTVREAKNGTYSVVCGERRLRAAELAGLKTVPCIVMKLSDENAAFTALEENIRQCDLNYFEFACSIERIHQRFFLSYEIIAEKLGLSMNELCDKMKLLSIPSDLRIKIIENGLTERHSQELVKLNDADKETLVKEIIEHRLSVSATRERVKQLKSANNASKKQKSVTYFKDTTIFVNTIDKALSVMEQSGIHSISSKREDDGFIEYHVTIPK